MKTPISALLAQKGSTVYTVRESATAQDAANDMVTHNIGCVLIVDDSRVLGVFTERDLLTRVVGPGLDPHTTPVTRVMSPLRYTVEPTEALDKAMSLISEKRTRHLPVLDDGKLVGLISIGDINKWVVERLQFETETLRGYVSGQYPG